MTKGRIPAELRRLVKARAGDCCEYCRCQEKYASDSFSIDHITPRSQQGKTTSDNLALACFGCNQHKASRTSTADPATDLAVTLFNPRQHRWDEHFAWNADFTLLIGLTPIERATIAALKRNRTGLINLRRVLYAIGEHPPAFGSR